VQSSCGSLCFLVWVMRVSRCARDRAHRAKRGQSGIEPETSRTLSENHAPRPLSQLGVCFFSQTHWPLAPRHHTIPLQHLCVSTCVHDTTHEDRSGEIQPCANVRHTIKNYLSLTRGRISMCCIKSLLYCSSLRGFVWRLGGARGGGGGGAGGEKRETGCGGPHPGGGGNG